ncbi:MAG: homocysteine S-methyltransferase family protein [Oscillospiraceae bacterium]|nr:homocysteine S-methyltransferase family protein [Oscillospiraceae bacterium]
MLDGAMGTMLQRCGLKPGEAPELLCLSRPELIASIHRSYIDSGSRIIYTNTFGANGYKLEGTGHTPGEVISAAVACARAAAGEAAAVALSVGPIGQMMEPGGALQFSRAYALFAEQVKAGAAAGADLVVFETMSDLYEVKAAVLAAKENTRLPVFVTMTFEDNHRTFTGCGVSAMAATLEGLGVDAVGINCSLGPAEILPIAKELASCTALPLIIKANAGLPDPATGAYDIGPEAFAEGMAPHIDLGAAYIGGCCGTTPEYIREIAGAFGGRTVKKRQMERKSIVCTPTRTVSVEGVRVIGERINPTGKKKLAKALADGDMDYILARAVEQADAGAEILDVNVGVPGLDEPRLMERTVRALQSVTDLPLQLDSSNPRALEAGLRVYNGKPIVNSVNGEEEALRQILPLVKKYGAAVVGLTMDRSGVPLKAEDRFAIAKKILEAALGYGIPKEDVYIDCLTLTVSAQQEGARETLNTLERVHRELGLRTVLGVSNVSFGLPNRELLNKSFLTLAMGRGLNLPILNPNSRAMMDAVQAFRVFTGEDLGAVSYIERFANAPAAVSPALLTDPPRDLSGTVARGLKEEVRSLTRGLLETMSPMEVIQRELIPALDAVGEKFEKGVLFLPQLIAAAAAAQEGFEVVRSHLGDRGESSSSKGKIIMATVKGDIHDIGKNITKVILSNYGYSVIDLGRDVPPEQVVEAAVKRDVPLVGLSALMTTTLASMEQTIQALRRSGHPCRIMVGGAVLTMEYAKKIGADYYAKDAKQAVDIAKEVLG